MVPKFDEMMKPLLALLADGNVRMMGELVKELAGQFQMTEADLAEMLPSGTQPVFLNRVTWAKSYLKKAGLIESPKRSACQITDAGRRVLEENPQVIDVKYLKRFPGFSKTNGGKPATPPNDQIEAGNGVNNLTPNDQLEKAYEEINDGLAADVLDEVMKISDTRFEKMVLDLLLKMGYGAPDRNRQTKRSGDGGIDGIVMQDKLGFNLIYMQAKHWDRAQTVGKPMVQSFVGAIAKKDGNGLFVTTAKFSEGAKEYADEQHVILIDGDRLARLMIEYNFCVAVKNTFEIKKIDTDAFLEYQEE